MFLGIMYIISILQLRMLLGNNIIELIYLILNSNRVDKV